MCSWVGAIVQAVGSDVSAAGNVYNLNQQAGAAKTNALRAESAAADAMAQGDWQATNTRLKTGRLMAGQRAAAGASGFDINSESYRDVMAGSAQNYTLDVQMLRHNAIKAAETYRQQAADFRQASDAYRTSAVFSVVGGALMSGGQVASGMSSWVDKQRQDRRLVTDPNPSSYRDPYTLGFEDNRTTFGKGNR